MAELYDTALIPKSVSTHVCASWNEEEMFLASWRREAIELTRTCQKAYHRLRRRCWVNRI